MTMKSIPYREGHDAFIAAITAYRVPSNPYSAALRKSHAAWNNGVWDAAYEWKARLSVEDLMTLAKVLNGVPA